MRWDQRAPFVIGHRGAPRAAPENTLAAFRAAIDAGAPAIELDARLSSDGIVVVHHDPALGRMLQGTGEVERLDAAALRAASVPTLADVLRALPDALVDVELKADAASSDALPGAVARVVRDARAEARVLVSSFDPMLANECAELAGVPAGFIAPFPVDAEDLKELPRVRHVMMVADAAFPEAIAALTAQGVRVHAWTVDDVEQANALWASGVSGVITDEPARLVRALRASSASNP